MNRFYSLLEHRGLSVFQNKAIKSTGLFLEFFTSKTGGGSKGPYESLNLGFNTGDRIKDVKKNMEKVKRDFRIKKIYSPVQIHSDKIAVACEETFNYIKETEADAIITAERNAGIAVKTADCTGNIIVDPKHRTAAAVHAGRRGVENRIIQKTVELMKKEFGSDPSDLIVSMSPAIGPASYFVGPEVYEPMRKEKPFAGIFKEKKGGITMNMWQGNKNLLLEAGVKEGNIYINDMDTYKHKKLFYSYRRDGVKTGRMMACVMIK
ncbi:MAG: peptidoglycan editing factor PgeF [Candidatus Goldiibacteriota bacterium]